MKLKAVYSSLVGRAVTGDAYKNEDTKSKKSEKSSKKTGLKPKWQPLSKAPKSPTKNKSPSKSPCLIEESLPPPTSPPPTKPTVPNRNCGSPPTILDRHASPDLPSPIKPVDATTAIAKSIDKNSPSRPDKFKSNAAYLNHAASFVNENGEENRFHRYDEVALEEFKSTKWSPVSLGNGDVLRTCDRLPHNLEAAASFNNQKNSTSCRDGRHFEDLQNEMMKKYGFVGLNGAISFDFTRNNSNRNELTNISTSHNDVLAVSRSQASDQRSHTNALRENKHDSSASITSSKRTSSFCQPRSQPAVDWSDIPPLVPPREPVRCCRVSPPLRSVSTPSPTTTAQVFPPTTSSSSNSLTNENTRKYQSSTAAVFSAIPSGLSGSNPVILPIMKDGIQESHTHYFLLGDEKSIPKHMRPTQPKTEPFNGIARPTPSAVVTPFNRYSGPPPPRPPPPSSSLFTSPYNFSSTSVHPASTYPPRRVSSMGNPSDDRSRASTRYNEMGPGQKVVAVQSEVFGVTDDECQSALRTYNWDVAKSIKYLKIEQLYQLGLCSTKEESERTLQSNNWDLQAASRLLLESHRRTNRS